MTESINPFPGLRPFEAEEDYLFFGREDQISELLLKLQKSRFLAVVGTSGSGKSSLVRAGLLPSLYGGFIANAGSNWRVAIFRPGINPIGNLASSLIQPEVLDNENESDVRIRTTITETTLRRSAMGLREVVRQRRLPDGENLLVVVDQFEELFRYRKEAQHAHKHDDATAFVKLLLTASKQNDIPVYVVITMRSDFLGDCAQFRDLPEAINDGQYRIPRMAREERRIAITGPAAVFDAKLSPRLVNRLLNDVGDNPDQLPIIQHALMRTWENWQTNKQNNEETIDLPHYEAIGKMENALNYHADEAYGELTMSKLKTIAEKLFKCLTEKGQDNREVRRPAKLGVIVDIVESEEKEVIEVIDIFRKPGRSFLMPPGSEALDKETLIDISHESLIRNWIRLKTWVNEESISADIYLRLAETAVLYGKKEAGLWGDPDLQLALTWKEKSKPNKFWADRYHPEYENAIAFLIESKKEKEDQAA